MTTAKLYFFRKISDKLKVVFDVGAREDLDFYAIKPDCNYHLFEPNPNAVSRLEQAAKGVSNIRINPNGLSDAKESGLVYYEGIQALTPHPFIGCDPSDIRCDVDTIDNYVKANKIASIDFLKIDAEGMDYRILKGASKTISENKIKFIQFEYWDGVAKFNELLSNVYDLYYVEDLGQDAVLRPLTDEVVNLIDAHRIPQGHGGDIVAAHKNEGFVI